VGFSSGPASGKGLEHFEILAFTDEPAAAAGLKRVLSASGPFSLTAVHDNFADLGAALCALKPPLLLLDLTPCITTRAILELREKAPDCRIVLWVRAITPLLAHRAVQHGVCGILRKTAATADFLRCLEVVAQGGLWFEGALQGDGRESGLIRISQREGQLMGLVAMGLKNKEVATEMGISEGGVKVYLSRLFRKLGVESRTELTIQALRNASEAEENLEPPFRFSQLQGRESTAQNPALRSFAGCSSLRGWRIHAGGRLSRVAGNPAAQLAAPTGGFAVPATRT
jgi:DNA-binding NarL/FixJ family response regulator